MVTIELTQEEQTILLGMLDTCISDLHSEIHHTDRFDYKESLKKRKDILIKLLNQIQHSSNAVPAV